MGKKTAHPFPTHLHLDRDEDFYIPLRSTHEISQEFLRVLIMVTLQHFIKKNVPQARHHKPLLNTNITQGQNFTKKSFFGLQKWVKEYTNRGL